MENIEKTWIASTYQQVYYKESTHVMNELEAY